VLWCAYSHKLISCTCFAVHVLLLKSKKLDQVRPLFSYLPIFSLDVAVPKLDLSVRVAMLLGRSIGPSQILNSWAYSAAYSFRSKSS
jgi:hypothetical protein